MNISASTGPLSLCLPSSPSTITPQPHSSLAIEPFNRTTPVISPFNPAQIEDIYPHVIVHEKGLLPTGEQDNSPERIFYIIGEKLRAYLINPLGNVTQKIGRTTQSVISTLSNALPSFPVAYAADVPLVHIEHGDTIYTAGIPIEKKLRNEIIESANFIWEKHPIVFLGEIHTDPSSIQIRQALQEGAINQKFRCFTEGISTHNHNGLLFGLALPEDVYMKTVSFQLISSIDIRAKLGSKISAISPSELRNIRTMLNGPDVYFANKLIKSQLFRNIFINLSNYPNYSDFQGLHTALYKKLSESNIDVTALIDIFYQQTSFFDQRIALFRTLFNCIDQTFFQNQPIPRNIRKLFKDISTMEILPQGEYFDKRWSQEFDLEFRNQRFAKIIADELSKTPNEPSVVIVGSAHIAGLKKAIYKRLEEQRHPSNVEL